MYRHNRFAVIIVSSYHSKLNADDKKFEYYVVKASRFTMISLILFPKNIIFVLPLNHKWCYYEN